MTTHNKEGLPEPFRGFDGPNYTQVPDALFDELLAFLSGSETKVLLYIIRRTFGFKRDSDTISLSQMLTGITTRDGKVLDHGTGLSKPSLLRALRSLQEQRIIFTERRRSAERGDEPTVYRLNIREEPRGKKTSLPVVKKVDQGGGQETSPGPWAKKLTTQETGEQETGEQEFYTSNIRKDQPGRLEGEGIAQSPDGSSASLDPVLPPGTESVGNVLARRGGNTGTSRPRPETETDEYQRIQALIADRAREFADTASLKSSTTRAWNLYLRSGVSIAVFDSKIFQAKSLTMEATGRITKTVEDPTHRVRRKSKMAYFFATLEDQLDLLTPEERARREGLQGQPPSQSGTRGRPAKARPSDQDQPPPGRQPDSQGPYAAYIKS